MDILHLPDEILDPIFNFRCNEIENEILNIEIEINLIDNIANYGCKIDYLLCEIFDKYMNNDSYTIDEVNIIANTFYDKYKCILLPNSLNYFHKYKLIDCITLYPYIFLKEFNGFYKIYTDDNNKEYFNVNNINVYFKDISYSSEKKYKYYYFNKYNEKNIIYDMYDIINYDIYDMYDIIID